MAFLTRLINSGTINRILIPTGPTAQAEPQPSNSIADPLEVQTIAATTKNSKVAESRLKEQGIALAANKSTKEETDDPFANSSAYYKKAGDAAKLLSRFRTLATDLQSPGVPDEALFEQLKATAPKEFLAEVRKNIALFTHENVDEVLEKNPRILLQIKDHSGKNLIEQYRAHLAEHLENLRDLGSLYYIQYLLGDLEKVHSSTAAKELLDEIRTFVRKLSPATQQKIAGFLTEHLTAPSELNEILKLIDEKPEILLQNFSRTNALEHRITKSELKTHSAFHFSGAYQLADQIIHGDGWEAAVSIKNLNQLQDFYTQLLKPRYPGQKKIIFEQFSRLDAELKTAIGKSLWIACYQPDMPFFSDSLIQRDPYILLDCKSRDGRDVIVQLMDHYKSKAVLHRFLPAYEKFAAEFDQLHSNEKLLKAFSRLPEFAKSDLAHLVWYAHGGKKDPKFGHWGYGEGQIWKNAAILKEGKPSILSQYAELLQKRLSFHIQEGVDRYNKEMTMPKGMIDCSTSKQLADPTLEEEMPADMPIAMVAAEFAGVINMGGLAPAIEGMARAYGVDKTRIILPKYDVINPKIQLVEKPKYHVELSGKIYKVFKGNVNGFKCYFIEDEVFNVGRDKEGKPNNIYNGTYNKNPDAEVKRRWAHLQSHAAELVYKLSTKKKNPVQLVHVHDAQTALIPKIMEVRHFDEWREGKTPATVFTYHNNNSPLPYDYQETQEILSEIGLPPNPISSFVEGLEHADMSTTVSETFANETQTELYGKGMQRYVRINGFKGKLVGIVNGNTNGWNPKTDAQLKTWKTVDGKTIDLTYGPDDPDLPDKIQMIREQLALYMKHHKLAQIDPSKPIFFYVGRYDAYQKGIDKLPLIMREAMANGTQFICIGLEPDEKADAALKEMEEFARSKEHKGVCIIRDHKRPDGRLHWQQGNSSPEDTSGVQGFGSLLRAAVDVGIFPSIFEPCGLVQGEMHRMGVETAATATGGFVDTIFTSGPNRNGYLFARFPNWDSEQQNAAIVQTVKEAAVTSKARLSALYEGNGETKEESVVQKRIVMKNAANSSWDKTFDGSLSPIDRLKRAYGKSMRHRRERGVIPLDVHGLRLKTYG